MTGPSLQHSPSLVELVRMLEGFYPADPTWPSGDWPVRGDFESPELEVVLGAILTQNTRWDRAQAALDRLAAEGVTHVAQLLGISEAELQSLIRPAGFQRRKSRTIQEVSRLLLNLRGGMVQINRTVLLSINGIGPETADAILLYAYGLPLVVVDAYTRRFLERLGRVDPESSLARTRAYLADRLPPDPGFLKRFHALVVQHSKVTCSSRPLCDRCPIRSACKSGAKGGCSLR